MFCIVEIYINVHWKSEAKVSIWIDNNAMMRVYYAKNYPPKCHKISKEIWINNSSGPLKRDRENERQMQPKKGKTTTAPIPTLYWKLFKFILLFMSFS